jgi:hypothetical protein
VRRSRSEPFRAEDRGPFIEWQVAGDKRGAALIALAEHLKEEFRTDSRERHVAQFVNNQQFDCIEVLLASTRPRPRRRSMHCRRVARVLTVATRFARHCLAHEQEGTSARCRQGLALLGLPHREAARRVAKAVHGPITEATASALEKFGKCKSP